MKKVTALMLGGLLASQAFSQITLTDGTASLSFTNTISGAAVRTGTTGGTCSIATDTGAPDHLFQNWWWYRLPGDTREFAFSNLVSSVVSGNDAYLIYDEGPFRAYICLNFRSISATQARYRWDMVLESNSLVEFPLALFNYMDFDMNGTAGGDSAVFETNAPNPNIRVTDGTVVSPFGDFHARRVDAYQAGAFSTVRLLLTNATIDNFANTGMPFGPGDWTAGYQWNLNFVSPGQRIRIYEVGSIGVPGNAPWPDQLVNAASYALLAGIPFGGGLAELQASDDQHLFILNDETEPNSGLEVGFIAPMCGPDQVFVGHESAATRDDLSMFTSVLNVRTNNYDAVGFKVMTLADSISADVVPNPLDHIAYPSRGMRMRMRIIPQTDLEVADGWSERFDHAFARFSL